MISLDRLRRLITDIGVCTDAPPHEVRCNDEELRQVHEALCAEERKAHPMPIGELEKAYHKAVDELLLCNLERGRVELERDKALRAAFLSSDDCEHVHHSSSQRHRSGDPCPVEAEIIRLLDWDSDHA